MFISNFYFITLVHLGWKKISDQLLKLNIKQIKEASINYEPSVEKKNGLDKVHEFLKINKSPSNKLYLFEDRKHPEKIINLFKGKEFLF